MVTVSIITPVYNGSKWLDKCIECVHYQTYIYYEFILIDDCSTDNTFQLLTLHAEKDSRIKVIKTNENGGPARARNVGIQIATGRFLAFLDIDDIWYPHKLEVQLNYMIENDIAFCYHDYRHASHDAKRTGLIVKGPNTLTWSKLHRRRGVGCLSVMIDRKRAPHFQFYELTILSEDFYAWANLLKKNNIKAKRLPLCLGLYRLANTSLSANKVYAVSSVWNIYRHVEKITFPRVLLFFLGYVIDATRIHIMARPIFLLNKIKHKDILTLQTKRAITKL